MQKIVYLIKAARRIGLEYAIILDLKEEDFLDVKKDFSRDLSKTGRKFQIDNLRSKIRDKVEYCRQLGYECDIVTVFNARENKANLKLVVNLK